MFNYTVSDNHKVEYHMLDWMSCNLISINGSPYSTPDCDYEYYLGIPMVQSFCSQKRRKCIFFIHFLNVNVATILNVHTDEKLGISFICGLYINLHTDIC